MNNEKRYHKNFELFAKKNPLVAYQLEQLDCSQIAFCQTVKGELNLVKNGDRPICFHSQEGALEEEQKFFRSLSLNNVQALFIFGLGLGYFYEAAKNWLKESKDRYLVFLEDDARVIRRFLETSRATEVLKDRQVFIHYFSIPDNYDWGNMPRDFGNLFWTFAPKTVYLTALPVYFLSRFSFFHQFTSQFYMNMAQADRRLREFRDNQDLKFVNFYANLPQIGESSYAKGLYGNMNQMPAIICGAGPSLEPQLSLLRTLKEKAVIMAAGSAMNILNQYGIIPHFGGAMDATPTQVARHMANFAYEVPYFYQNFYNKKSFEHLHGPKIYVNGSENFNTAEWFEENLDIGCAKDQEVISAVSTTSFLLEVAKFLGCNPIILIGVDLAYTSQKRYSPGVKVHPTAPYIEWEKVMEVSQVPFLVGGIEGGSVNSHWVWLLEAGGITAFKKRNPEIELINCTRQGMKILEVPHQPFEQIVEEKLKWEFDYQSWIHGIIQNSPMPEHTDDHVLEVLEKWKESLKNCIRYCRKPTNLAEIELETEPAYTHLLHVFDNVYEVMHRLDKGSRRARFDFLKKYAAYHLELVKQALKDEKIRRKKLKHKKAPKQKLPKEVLGKLKEGQKLYYSNETIMVEAGYENEILNGPFVFYGPDGKILSQSSFTKGKRDGLTRLNYANGLCYSLQRYENGLAEGKHIYYYPDGVLKTELNYKNGKLDGEVKLYFPNGKLQRELHFKEGQLFGKEQIWDISGQIVFEHHYE